MINHVLLFYSDRFVDVSQMIYGGLCSEPGKHSGRLCWVLGPQTQTDSCFHCCWANFVGPVKCLMNYGSKVHRYSVSLHVKGQEADFMPLNISDRRRPYDIRLC